ncbi:hypothetical protein N658DRAFT_50940 [Parathielavia hyrcaniae]|uniref:Uncharacterized protein n=1 Tax=Parathielavia hyrcaniae TaxID=113614 RepID=A0AAN6T1T6_9PEZI|nr:hypothetical protein N658DRAFT_50940 [Parathielavia hyrcaniae]
MTLRVCRPKHQPTIVFVMPFPWIQQVLSKMGEEQWKPCCGCFADVLLLRTAKRTSSARCSRHDATTACFGSPKVRMPCSTPYKRNLEATVRCSALRLEVAVSGPSSRRGGRRRQSGCSVVAITKQVAAEALAFGSRCDRRVRQDSAQLGRGRSRGSPRPLRSAVGNYVFIPVFILTIDLKAKRVRLAGRAFTPHRAPPSHPVTECEVRRFCPFSQSTATDARHPLLSLDRALPCA